VGVAPDKSGSCGVHHLVATDVLVPAGETIEILLVNESGLFEFALVDSPDPNIEVILQLDDQPEPLAFESLQHMRDVGLDEHVAYHWYTTKFDLMPVPRYVGVWDNESQEPYYKRIRFALRNLTAAPITVRRVEIRHVIISQEVK